MEIVISGLIILVCLLLILVVLIQNSKGGGLASSFASSNQVMGVQKTGDVVEKATWVLAASLLVLCLISTAYNKPSGGVSTGSESVTRQKAVDAGSAPAADPNAAPVPAENK
jgi:preprotein translocase subunit SecG